MTSVLNDTVLHVLATLSPVVCLCTILFIDNNFLLFKFCASLNEGTKVELALFRICFNVSPFKACWCFLVCFA